MKILVTSIRFTNEGKNLLGDQKDGSRALVVELNTGKEGTIDLEGDFCRIRRTDGGISGRFTKTEIDVLMLVFHACVSYLLEDEPETMSYSECAAAGELAEERIDWSDWPEGEDGERLMELENRIAHYEDF